MASPITSPESDPLRSFYQTLTGKGGLPLNPDHPYYVDIHGHTPAKDPILQLYQRIIFAESESVNFLTGYRGNGKSTELRRLKSKLEADGCRVILVNMLDYLLMTKPPELSDFTLSLMAALSAAVEQDLGSTTSNYWERLTNFMKSEVEIDSVKIPIGAAQLGLKLKTDSTFKDTIQQHLRGHLTRLIDDARTFIDQVVNDIRQQENNPDKKVVLLVDSLEQLRGSGDDAEKIHAAVVELFAAQAQHLEYPKLHIVYTIPPYLTALAHNIGRSLGNHPITQWPNIHIRNSAGKTDGDAEQVMMQIIARRFAEWEKIIPKTSLQKLAKSSGGDLRDFFRLVSECIIALSTKRMDEPAAKLTDKMVEQVEQQLRNELLPIAADDAIWLAEIHETKETALPNIEKLPSLARFLDCNLIMNYLNGKPWYDIHPLLILEIKKYKQRPISPQEGEQ